VALQSNALDFAGEGSRPNPYRHPSFFIVIPETRKARYPGSSEKPPKKARKNPHPHPRKKYRHSRASGNPVSRVYATYDSRPQRRFNAARNIFTPPPGHGKTPKTT